MSDKPNSTAPDSKPGAPLVFVGSLDEVAAALGTTERQWRTYSKRDGFPAKVEGKGYDLRALAKWKEEHVAQKGNGELAAAKKLKLEKEIELLEMRIAKEQKASVLRSEVSELHGRLAQRLRAFLCSKLINEMPPKVAGCDALTIRVYAQSMVHEILTALAKDIDQWETQ